jgi:hypothetical protein
MARRLKTMADRPLQVEMLAPNALFCEKPWRRRIMLFEQSYLNPTHH